MTPWCPRFFDKRGGKKEKEVLVFATKKGGGSFKNLERALLQSF